MSDQGVGYCRKFRYMIVGEINMRPIVWLIILGPPCLAFVIWRYGGVRGRAGDITVKGGFKVDLWQSVQLGKYGFWIILALTYIVTLATALVEHKI